MKVYRVGFVDGEDQKAIWCSSRKLANKEAASLRRDPAVEQVFDVHEMSVTPTKKGILQFLNLHASR